MSATDEVRYALEEDREGQESREVPWEEGTHLDQEADCALLRHGWVHEETAQETEMTMKSIGGVVKVKASKRAKAHTRRKAR